VSKQAEASSNKMTTLPKPYLWFWHPYKSLLDTVIDFLLGFIIPTYKMSKHPPSKDSKESVEITKSIRDGSNKLAKSEFKSKSKGFNKWASLAGCDIIECNYKISRRPLLKEWGLYRESLEETMPSEDILVKLHFPVSIFPHKQTLPEGEKNEVGCLPIDNLDISKLPNDVPMIVYFHGGGMTIGSAYDRSAMDMINKVVTSKSKPLIFASVAYSLAPEVPFPAAPVEGMTVIDHFLQKCPGRNIHIAGISAGGYLTAVTTMECFRRYPDRIGSSLIAVPMLDPAVDSMSYYLNSHPYGIANIKWLRWCWQSYLEMPTSKDTDLDTSTLYGRLAKDSNRTAWEQSKWRHTSIERLIKPIVGIPNGLNSKKAPKIIIITNEADCLRDDGIALAKKLEAAEADVKLMRCSGSHWLGTLINKKFYGEVIESWQEALFGETE